MSPRSTIPGSGLLLVVAAACGPSVVLDDGTTGGADGSSDSGSEMPSPTSPDTFVTTAGDEDATGSPDDTGGVPLVCGDGIVAPGESCDDANADPYDGCNADCRVPGEVLFRVQLEGDEITGLLGESGTVYASTNTYNVTRPGPAASALVYGLDEVGGTLWSWSTDAGITAFDGSLAARLEGGVHVLGLELPAQEPEQPYVRAFAPDGGIAWTTGLDSGLGEILAHPEGGVYVTDGSAREATTVVRLAASGEPVWPMPLELPGSARAITVTPSGGLVVSVSADDELMALDGDGSVAWTVSETRAISRGWIRGDTLEIFASDNAYRLVQLTLDGIPLGEREVPEYGVELVPGGGYVAPAQGEIIRWDDDLQERWRVETDFVSFQRAVEPTRILLGSMLPNRLPAPTPPEILAVAI